MSFWEDNNLSICSLEVSCGLGIGLYAVGPNSFIHSRFIRYLPYTQGAVLGTGDRAVHKAAKLPILMKFTVLAGETDNQINSNYMSDGNY